MSLTLDRSYIQQVYQGQGMPIFGEGGLFEKEDNNQYILSIDDDIEIFDKDVFGEDFNLDTAMDKANILNFRKVSSISDEAFESLISNNANLEFYFEAENIRIKKDAFGEKFEKLKRIYSNGKEVNLLLHAGCFSLDVINSLEKIEEMNVFLYGTWEIETILKIVDKVDKGKVYNAKGKNDFSIEGDKEKSLSDDRASKMSKELIELVADTRFVVAREAAKVAAKKIKEKEDIERGIQPEETKFISWDKLDHVGRESMINFVIDQMAEHNFTIKAEVNIDKLKKDESGKLISSNGKLVLNEDCFEKIKLVGVMGLTDILKLLSAEEFGIKYNIKLLKNDKNNRDKVKEAVKKYIAKNWEMVITKKGLQHIISLDNKKLEKLTEGNKDLLELMRKENNIENKVVVENIEEAKQYFANLQAAAEQVGPGGALLLKPDQYTELVKSIKIMGNEYKNKDKKIAIACKKFLNELESYKKGE